ncbi:hypothetical protein HDU97_002053 [Phlyctochytrium planicorne]|nr:hypothetical protein HDU97_002053 [Phlyctochytrium planicorne]
MCLAYLNLRQIDEAINCLTRAISCDVYLAVAYFQRGVCFYSKNMLSEALADFTDALAFLRGNLVIDYTQLGLAYKLYACEVSFNRGLCFAAVGQTDAAMADFDDAMRTRPLDGGGGADHRRIEEALDLQDRAPDYLRPYDVPANIVYKPPPGKVKNVAQKDYLGKSKVVAAYDGSDGWAGFSGTKLKAQTSTRDNTKAPTEMENSFSRSATIARTATAKRPGGHPEAGLDGTPLTFAALNKRAQSATNNVPGEPTSTSSANSSAPGRRPSAPAAYATRVSSVRAPPKPEATLPTPPGSAGKDRRIEDEVDEMMRYAAAQADGGDRGRGDRGGRERSESRGPPGRRPNTPPMSGDEGGDYDPRSERGRTPPPAKYDEDLYSNSGGLPRRNTTMSVATSSSAGDKLKIKCHLNDTKILLAVPTTVTFDDLAYRIQRKFGVKTNLRFKYKDMDGEMVMMTDQEDMEVAFEMAGIEYCGPGGTVGNGNDRFEVWCSE